jgi:thiol-disulfide isomerase/thioredoxin
MPSTPITGADGELTDLRAVFAQENKLTLVNVWATWCGPCVAELPSLSALAQSNPNIRIITVSVDRNYEDAAQFLGELGAANLPLYHDNTFAIVGKTGMKASGVPISVFYDKTGRELARLAGEADWQSEEADALIAYFLEQESR